MKPAIRFVEARSSEEFQQAAQLMREFVAWARTRYQATPEMIDAYFDAVAWENELASLSEEYSSSNGAVLLAVDANEQARWP